MWFVCLESFNICNVCILAINFAFCIISASEILLLHFGNRGLSMLYQLIPNHLGNNSNVGLFSHHFFLIARFTMFSWGWVRVTDSLVRGFFRDKNHVLSPL